jgi:hypothetical protein
MGTEETELDKQTEPSEIQTEKRDTILPRHIRYKSGLVESLKAQRELASVNANKVGSIPEANKIKITRFDIDLNMRRAQLEYVQGVAKSGEMLALREHIVRWQRQ